MTLLLIIIPALFGGFMLGYFYKESEPNRRIISLENKLKSYEKIINNLFGSVEL